MRAVSYAVGREELLCERGGCMGVYNDVLMGGVGVGEGGCAVAHSGERLGSTESLLLV